MTTANFNGNELVDAVPEAIITNVRRSLLGTRRTVFQDVPGVAGSWTFGDQPGDRKIVLSIHILGDDFADRRDAVRRLAAWADSTAPAGLVLDDEPDRAEYAILTSTPEPDEMLLAASVDLEFRSGPYAYAMETSSASWSASSGVAHSLSVPDDVDVFPIVTLTAGASPVSSLTLTVGERTLSYGTPLAAHASITISSMAFVVTEGENVDDLVVGTFDPEAVSMADVDGQFPVLTNGTNSVTVTTAGGSAMDVDVLWRRRYR
jgi:predicted phage tail component-like protein